MRRTYGALALVLALVGCESNRAPSPDTGHSATQTTAAVTPSAARLPADADGFLTWIARLRVANAEPFARANEICDWFDQGYTLSQVTQAETAVIQRDWSNVLDPYGRTAVNAYEIGFLISGSAKFVCPEHASKLSG